MSRKRRSPAVSMALASVSKDVLTEILLRLPAKTLIKFKSVCKKWLSLISSDYFCHQHTLRRPKLQQSLILQMQTMQFFYFNRITNSEKVMIPYTLSVPHHEIVQDSNGLLLLEFNRLKNCDYVYNPTTKDLTRHVKHSYYVYNPTTRQSRKITLTQSDKFPYVEAITLAFDPSKSPYYKLVCVRSTTYPTWAACPRQIEPHAYRIEVYDSESHTWKLGLEPSTCPRISHNIGRSFNEGVVWNNSIFWRNYYHHHHDNYCCFDIAKNEIKSLSAPPNPDRLPGYIYESNGHLYYFELLREHQSVTVEVWEWGGDDQSQWLSMHRGAIHPPSRREIIPLRFVGGWSGDGATGSLLIYEFSLHEKSSPKMMAYNFLDNSYELLVGFTGKPVPRQRLMKGFQFGETLALV